MKKYKKSALIANGHISAEKKYYPDNRVANHSHEFFEFEYIIKGQGSYSIDGVEYPIADKTIYFMTPVNFHNVNMIDTAFYNVMFSADMCSIGKLSGLFTLKPTVIAVDENTNDLFCALLDELCKYNNNIEYASAILETIIIKICSLNAKRHIQATSDEIRKCELYIIENFRKKLNLSDISKYAMLSESHFSRKFASETGKNFKDYLNSIRYAYAEKLLLYSDMTVLQICRECGFSDYPNFVRRFKKRTEVTPLEYRRKNRSNKHSEN